MESEMGYIVAKGPEGLEEVLAELLEKTKQDPAFKTKVHYVLYELGNQKSLIKMDFNEQPVIFWHYDLLGRAATTIVKDVLARFAWEKCGERECHYKDTSLDEAVAFQEWRVSNFDGKLVGE